MNDLTARLTLKRFTDFVFVGLVLCLLFRQSAAQIPPPDTIKTTMGNIIIQPIFHGAIVLTLGDKTIYVDPYNGLDYYRNLAAPDLILVTHTHQDHMDTSTLRAIDTSKAKFVVPQTVAEALQGKFKSKITVLNNGRSTTEAGIAITAIPMYNLPEDSVSRHLKGKGNGYVLEYVGKRIYISGDTEDIPEMRQLKGIDIAFVCMNLPFTMTVHQAASAVREFRPKIVYPFHYRNMNGFSDVNAFKSIVEEGKHGIEVRVRNWYSRPVSKATVTRFENVVYGMVAGASLTMDVYKPDNPNGRGILVIPGTAFGYAYSNEYSQASMTSNFKRDTIYFGKYARMLADKGYTIFVVNHRLAPHFRYRDILGDCQRAVRYVRFNAAKYAIDPDHIGAFGYSSGATLCAMLGVTDWADRVKHSGLNAVSSRVQSVVTLAARFDLSDFNRPDDTTIQNPIISRVLLNFVGELPAVENGAYVLTGKYAEASPITYVDRGDATFLIYSSSDDPLVPKRQPTNMFNKLISSEVEAKLNMSEGDGHTPLFNVDDVDAWFLKHLKMKSR